MYFFFFQAEDGIRDLVRSRGLGDVYKRQGKQVALATVAFQLLHQRGLAGGFYAFGHGGHAQGCLLYTSDAADERSSVDLGGRRIITKKNKPAISRVMDDLYIETT